MSEWRVKAIKADFKRIAREYNIDPVTVRLMVNRGIKEEDMGKFLHPDLNDLHDPHSISDMNRGCSLINDAVTAGENIRVFGDYDADGIFSTYILVDGIKRIGGKVSWQLPDRKKDGYGLNVNMVKKAITDGINVVLTCDNGIAASEAVDYARNNGLTVIVTDHHEIPYEQYMTESPTEFTDKADTENGIYDLVSGGRIYHLPHADAVIDPHRPDDHYPYKEICGAVVAFKFIQVLYEMTEQDHLEYMRYLSEAAFATITDVMPLKDENRAIVFHGLRKLGDSGNIGLDTLVYESGIDKNRITPYHVGFILGPAFNAAGRITSADKGEELLFETDITKAKEKAWELLKINNERKSMTEDGMKKAEDYIAEHGLDDKVLVIYLPDLHESLCGLVAGKLKEKYQRPAFVLSSDDSGKLAKGSGRSIERYSMFERLVEADNLYRKEHDGQGLFISFGGHPMAAGITVRPDDIDWLRKTLNEKCGLEYKDLNKKIIIDVPMPLWYVTPRLIDEIGRLEPCGTGNERPLFAEKTLSVVSYRKIGKESQYRKLKLRSKDTVADAVYFGDGSKMDDDIEAVYGPERLDSAIKGIQMPESIKFDIVYYPEINEFMGRRNVQAMIQDYKVK